MSAYFLIDPRFEPYRARAAEARAEVLSRLAYLAIEGVDRAVRSVVGFVASLVRTVIVWLRQWRERRAAIQALSRLDDRMLRDIGISRAEIYDAAAGRTRETEPKTAAGVNARPGIVVVRTEDVVTWRKAA